MVAYWKAFIKNLLQVARLQLRSPCLFRCYCIAACNEWSYSFAIYTFHCTYEIFYIYAVHKIWLIHSTYFIHPLFLLQSWLYYSFLCTCICPSRALDLWINICIANLKFYLFVSYNEPFRVNIFAVIYHYSNFIASFK